MNGEFYILICDGNGDSVEKSELVDKAMEALDAYKRRHGGAYGESRGGMNYRTDYLGAGHPERIGEMAYRNDYPSGTMPQGMTDRERHFYEMGKRDAYGRNGAENFRGHGGHHGREML